MSHVFFLVSTGSAAGLTTVSLGMVRALDRLGIRTGFYKPVAQLHDGDDGPERSTRLIAHVSGIAPPQPMSLRHAKSMLGSDKEGQLLEEVVDLYRQCARQTDVVIVEGLVADGHAGYATRLNAAIVQALDAEVILVGKPEPDLGEHIDIAAQAFSGNNGSALVGTILNLLPEEVAPTSSNDIRASSFPSRFHSIGAIPRKKSLMAMRMCDIATYLGAGILFEGELQQRRVEHIELCARSVANTLSVYQPHTLLIFPGDRDDVFIAACMSAMNGVPLAGILLTGNLLPNARVLELCAQAIATGLPVLQVETSSYDTAAKLALRHSEIAVDDFDLIEQAMDHVANHLDADWLRQRCAIEREPRLSPAAFRYQLIQQARQANLRIVLPEGDEPRTIMAAYQCRQRGIAQCILLGNPEKIRHAASSQGITLHDDIRIIDPTEIRPQYVDAMVALRQHKGMTAQMAEDQLQDHVVLGTMMLALEEVDGLVSGALHTTANTVRPAFQLIGAHEHGGIVSSIFFMCLPDQVVVYGDCAINPDPDAQQLADIAMQSADSASHFGLQPRVAMISYSTGESGSGNDVDKVREATRIVHQRRPDILVDGPLQYDAAAVASVGKSKAPESRVAGKANVFIFPDLNTGNTTYKAVQRSAHVVSIGPMLQGLRKPVNDLSRGATVEDIVYTIALTAIQANR
ncbi:MAG: phosphate acetyltransferase [Mariprofundaceae bacterium]|nr:phosphate acetyltransferase [Mariprofundaceae bacterium]